MTWATRSWQKLWAINRLLFLFRSFLFRDRVRGTITLNHLRLSDLLHSIRRSHTICIHMSKHHETHLRMYCSLTWPIISSKDSPIQETERCVLYNVDYASHRSRHRNCRHEIISACSVQICPNIYPAPAPLATPLRQTLIGPGYNPIYYVLVFVQMKDTVCNTHAHTIWIYYIFIHLFLYIYVL